MFVFYLKTNHSQNKCHLLIPIKSDITKSSKSKRPTYYFHIFIKHYLKTTNIQLFYLSILIFSLGLIHKKFSNLTPCILILNNGSDPTADLTKLAKKNDITGPTFKVLSLGTCEENVS